MGFVNNGWQYLADKFAPSIGAKCLDSQRPEDERGRDWKIDIMDGSTSDAYEDHSVKADMDVANLQCDGNHTDSDNKESNFMSLPQDLQIEVLKNVNHEVIHRFKAASKACKGLVESKEFQEYFPKCAPLSPLRLCFKNGELQCSGYDAKAKTWKRLPLLWHEEILPQNIGRYFFVSESGLICANVSKSVECESIAVYNPMTQTLKVLPPLNFKRNPVLMHVSVDQDKGLFHVYVAGSSGWADGEMSRKTEVFDSVTSKWVVTGDIPGPEFALNEYQTGACVNGILYCVAFVDDASTKGLLAYDVKQGKWLSDWKIPLPCPEYSNSFSTTQVVECDNQVYLFSERMTRPTVEHRIDRLDNADRACGVATWVNVVMENMTSDQGLQIYPEYTCVRFGVGKLCIFNTLEHTGKVYDLRHGGPPEHLPPPQSNGVEVFHSLNPLSFTFEPNFKRLVGSDESLV